MIESNVLSPTYTDKEDVYVYRIRPYVGVDYLRAVLTAMPDDNLFAVLSAAGYAHSLYVAESPGTDMDMICTLLELAIGATLSHIQEGVE